MISTFTSVDGGEAHKGDIVYIELYDFSEKGPLRGVVTGQGYAETCRGVVAPRFFISRAACARAMLSSASERLLRLSREVGEADSAYKALYSITINGS